MVFLAAALGAAGAQADVLVGPHGERIPGRLIEATGEVIVFQSDFLGRLSVPADQARVEIVETPPVAGLRPQSPWSADLGAKLSIDRGTLKSREDKLGAEIRSVHRSAEGELNFGLDYEYKRTDGELKDDDWSSSVAYDRFHLPSRFTAVRLSARRELETDGTTNETDTLTFAYGWRLFETADRYLRIGPAFGYLSLSRGHSRSSGPAVGLYARGRGPAFGKTTYEYELQALDTLDEGRYSTFDLRWRKPIGERLYLALVWRYIRSDVEIESGFNSDWRWDIGWRFGPEP